MCSKIDGKTSKILDLKEAITIIENKKQQTANHKYASSG